MKCIIKFALIVALIGGITYIAQAADEAVSSEQLVAQAKEALAAQDSKTAVKLYEQALATSPDDAQLQTDYANALAVRINEVNFMAKGMIAGKMLKAYERSVEIDPNHIVGWIGQCRYYLNAPPIAGGSADKAEKFADEVMVRVPFLGHVELALVAEKRGDNAKAAEHFEAALELRPDHGEAIAGLKRVTAES